MESLWRAAAVLALVGLLAACGLPGGATPGGPTSDTPAAGADSGTAAGTADVVPAAVEPDTATGAGGGDILTDRPGLRPVPAPAMDQLSSEAQAQLGAEQSTLRRILARAAATDAELGEGYGSLGMVYHAYGLYAQAEPAYLNAADLMPDDPRWMYFLAHAYRELSRTADSERFFQRVLARGPRYLPTYVWLAALQLDAGRVDDAEETIVGALKLDQENPAVLFTAGRVSAARGKPEQAIIFFEEALELAPDSTEINYPLGLAYRAVGETVKAEQLMAQRGRVRPPLFDPLLEAIAALKQGTIVELERGLTAIKLGRYAEAETHFQKAIEQDPENVGAYTNLAVAQLRLGRPEAAAETLKAALAIKPDHLNANFNLGTILAQLGRDEDALPYYAAVLTADPKHQDAHYNLGNALARLGRLREAQDHFRQAVTLDPSDSRALQQYVTMLLELASWPEAAEALISARAALPEDPYLKRLQARFLSGVPVPSLRDPAEAIRLGEELLREESSSEDAQVLAMALASAGRFDEAVAQLDRALVAAQEAGNSGLVAEMNAELTLYRSGEGPRSPQSAVMRAPTPER